MPVTFLTLLFDQELERRVQGLQQRVTRAFGDTASVNPHRPHITLAAYATEDVRSVLACAEELANQVASFELFLHAPAVFPEKAVVFLAPRPTEALLRCHATSLERFASSGFTDLEFPNLRPHWWMPHCTVATLKEAGHVGQVVTFVSTDWVPYTGTAIGVGVLVAPDTVDRAQYHFRDRV